MILLLAKGVGMGGSPLGLAFQGVYTKEFLALKLDNDLSITLGLSAAHTALKNELESFIFFMGGR